MLRFIIERHEQNNNQCTDWKDCYTVDIDVPELEKALTRGGYGEMGFESHNLLGVEVLSPNAVLS